MEKFATIKFTSEGDAVAIISTGWLTEDRMHCFYPSGPNIEKHVRKHTEPAIDWKEFPIKILAEDVNYTDARRHLIKAQDTTNLDSDPDEPVVKRRRHAPIRFDPEESNEWNELSSNNNKKKNSKISPYPSLDSFSNASPSTSSIATFSTNPSPVPTFIPSTSSITTFSTNPSPVPTFIPSTSSNTFFHPINPIPLTSCITVLNASPSTFVNSVPTSFETITPTTALSQLFPSFTPVTSGTSERDNKLVMVIGQLQSTIADLVSEVKRLGQRLDSALLNVPGNTNNDGDKAMWTLGKLPMNSLDEFDSFEDNLREENFYKLLVKVLVSVGGKDIKSITYSILRRLLTCQLATKFSFTGKMPKNKDIEKKRPFSDT